GQAIANDSWPGRGVCSGQNGDYPKYIEGADVVSFDIYPDNETDPAVGGNLWFVAQGVDRLRGYANYKKPVFNWIETTGINDVSMKPSVEDVRAEVWMSIVHGSSGIGYFCHQFNPFDEHALLDDDAMKQAVGAINAQIASLAPVLNTPPLANAAMVTTSD